MTEVAVIGAGNSGLAMAAHLALAGNKVRLWNRTLEKIEPLIRHPYIEAAGVLEGKARIDLVTDDIGETIGGVPVILVTTPANSHPDIARLLAPHVVHETLVVLNPGRTFGAVDFYLKLKSYGCKVEPLIAETQTSVHTCRKTSFNQVNVLAIKQDVYISTLNPRLNRRVVELLPECLKKYFVPASSMIQTSLGNVGMILHCAPLLLNTGWVENPHIKFLHYCEGITPSVARFLEKLDAERIEVAERFGWSLESTAEWVKRVYGVKGNNLYECVNNNPAYYAIEAPKSLRHRYIFEDISCGLVPLEAVGRDLGCPMNICGLVIDLADALLDMNFRKEGRTVKADVIFTFLRL